MVRRNFVLCFIFVAAVLSLIGGCGEEEKELPENVYHPRIRISMDELQSSIQARFPTVTKVEFTEEDNRVYLDLGSIPESQLNDNHDAFFLERYFAMSPNNNFYGIKYTQAGVYGATYEKRVLQYFPKKHELRRIRTGGRIAFYENWTCMTYQDILDWKKNDRPEHDCYAWSQPPS